MPGLPNTFPFRDVLTEFIREYRRAESYWYVPKTRTLSEDNVPAIRELARIVGQEFADQEWNTGTQDQILARARELGILEPYVEDGSLQDRTALVRIWKKFLELLGLVWIRDGQELLLTPAGDQFLIKKQSRSTLEQQIAKYQYPNPGVSALYAKKFRGLVPHIFLLQAMQRLDYQISVREYDLFINLARSHDDLSRLIGYVLAWRDLQTDEQSLILATLKNNKKSSQRLRLIEQDSSYQRAFLTYPRYVEGSPDDEIATLVAVDREIIDSLVKHAELHLKIPQFKTLDEWFSYYGDPKQHPSWYTYLKHRVETATSKRSVQTLARANRKHMTPSEAEEIERLEIEKGIEEFYVTRLSLIEPGLKLVPKGRQYTTPIGRIDLLCKSKSEEYVVIEIKAAEATDAVFGQILRYIGWVHRKFYGTNVRGVILASKFPESARYSRIGLIKPDAEHFIQFKQHGLTATNS